MNDPVELTLALEREELEIFKRLAGGETQMASFLSFVLRNLQRERQLLGEDADLDQAICAAQRMVAEKRRYQEQVHTLQLRLRRLSARQAELIALLEYRQSVSVDPYAVDLYPQANCVLH